MKGISTILAMILIVIIVVALIGLTYTFAVNLFTTTSEGATGQAEAVTKRLDQSIGFVTDPTCTNTSDTWIINFTIRHTGATYAIADTDIDILVGNDQIGTISGWADMSPGDTAYLGISNSTGMDWSGTQTLTVSVPAAPVSKSVTCQSLS